METAEHPYSGFLVIAQHGPNNGKPFFGFITVKMTPTEYAAKFHFKVAQIIAVEQGCAPAPIVCCNISDLPEFIGRGLMEVRNETALLAALAFDVEPRHYEQARQLPDTTPYDNAAQESPATSFTVRTQTYDDGQRITVTAQHLSDALHRAALLIDGFTTAHVTEVRVGNTLTTDAEGNEVLIYGVGIEYERSE